MGYLRIGVFASGGGSNLQSLIDATRLRLINGNICTVISNNSSAFALERARIANIAAFHVSMKKYPEPSQYLKALTDILSSQNINLIVLAGYMKLLPVEIIQQYRSRIVNIHPALLPKYGGHGMYGINVHKAVLEAGEKFSGATVHLVDEVYDNGPILIQRRVPVLEEDTPESLAARVLEVEHKILPAAVSMFI